MDLLRNKIRPSIEKIVAEMESLVLIRQSFNNFYWIDGREDILSVHIPIFYKHLFSCEKVFSRIFWKQVTSISSNDVLSDLGKMQTFERLCAYRLSVDSQDACSGVFCLCLFGWTLLLLFNLLIRLYVLFFFLFLKLKFRDTAEYKNECN